MKRFDDWPARLNAQVESARSRPFAWGTHDCCIWAADVVFALTGDDLATAYRGTYSDAAGAARILHEHGGVESIATVALGTAITWKYAHRGDVVLIDQQGRPGLGICIGAIAAAPGDDGLVFSNMADCLKAWRV